jgi:glycosyltransferase involved in cell wall biosynthesis
MCEPCVSIILRSFNEGWALRDTLPALQAQDYKRWELIVIDSGSTDGSVALIEQMRPRHFIRIEPHEYNPGRVLNCGMSLARFEAGIFLNADATPQGSGWLRPLVKALADPHVAAAFGRQVPRPGCRAAFRHDYERCFGPRRESARWEHFFSMASSGIRKDVWKRRGFNERLQYSEDDEYTRWCVAHGYRIAYVPQSVVMHSHDYTLPQVWRRSFGEGKALAAVWPRSATDWNWARSVALGWARDVWRDLWFCLRKRRLHEWPGAMRIRWAQRRARLAGFRAGWAEFRESSTPGLPLPPVWASAVR